MSDTKLQNIIDTTTKQDDYIEILKQHFPSCINQLEDGSYTINTSQLQLMLEPKNCKLIEEHYGLSWVGKKEAYHNAYIPNNKILKPLINESKNFETTGNILIKGDNLDALKLLRKNYFEKIKMIYIDPPYNTENDGFIYKDNFTQSTDEILDYLGYDSERKDYIKNIAGAKTHSGWLSFMYPRLLLARDLLKDDGVIFISIDDNEQANLKLLCDEVFGGENSLTIACKMSEASGVKMAHVDKGIIPKIKEYILLCTKSNLTKLSIQFIEKEKWDKAYNQIIINCTKENTDFICTVIANEDRTAADIECLKKIINTFSLQSLNEYSKVNNITISDQWKIQNSYRIVQLAQYNGKINLYKTESDIYLGISPENKLYVFSKGRKLLFASDYLTVALGDMWWDIKTTGIAKEGGVIFKNGKKPLKLLTRCLNLANTKSTDIILDFFAGSGTTGDAVMQLNAQDFGGGGGGEKVYISTNSSTYR